MREFVVLAKAEMVNWLGRNVYFRLFSCHNRRHDLSFFCINLTTKFRPLFNL